MNYFDLNGALICSPDTTIKQAEYWLHKHPIEGVVVAVESDMTLCGIVTRRDLRYETRHDSHIEKVMTPKEKLVTASESARDEELKGLLQKYRVDKVIVVDEDFKFKNIIYASDFQNSDDPLLKQGREHFTKSISFEPEYFQAGISILTYFGSILREKYPNEHVSFKVSQEDLKVKLTIQSAVGKIEEIEKCLVEYGRVVEGSITPAQFGLDPVQALSLQNKIQIAELELNQTKQLLQLSQRTSSQQNLRVGSLESEVAWLRGQVGRLISGTISNQKSFATIIDSCTSNADSLVQQALKVINDSFEDGHSQKNEDAVKRALSDICENDPKIFNKVRTLIVEGGIAGVSGNILYAWLIPFINALPK